MRSDTLTDSKGNTVTEQPALDPVDILLADIRRTIDSNRVFLETLTNDAELPDSPADDEATGETAEYEEL